MRRGSEHTVAEDNDDDWPMHDTVFMIIMEELSLLMDRLSLHDNIEVSLSNEH